MEHPFFPILIVLIFGALFAGVFLGLSALIGPKKKKPSKAKLSPYECGLDPLGTAREQMDIKFFVLAMLFILFDIETVFLFPWAILYREYIGMGIGLFMLVEMGIFIVVLALGLFFIWRKGVLDWK